jgi:hypothetical protein
MSATNPDFAAGMARFRQPGTEDPMRPGRPLPSAETAAVLEAQTSPTGQVAKAHPDTPAGYQPDAAMTALAENAIGPRAKPPDIQDTLARLRREDQAAVARAAAAGRPIPDPQSAERAFRLYLEENWNRTAGDIQGGPNLARGAKFRNTVAGDPYERANIHAWVRGITGSDTVAQGFNTFLDNLRRTGLTPGMGSPTASRSLAFREARESGLLNTLADVPAVVAGKLPLKQRLENRAFAKTYSRLAELTTNPDAVRDLQRLALMNPDSPRAKALTRSIYQMAFPTLQESEDNPVQ